MQGQLLHSETLV